MDSGFRAARTKRSRLLSAMIRIGAAGQILFQLRRHPGQQIQRHARLGHAREISHAPAANPSTPAPAATPAAASKSSRYWRRVARFMIDRLLYLV